MAWRKLNERERVKRGLPDPSEALESLEALRTRDSDATKPIPQGEDDEGWTAENWGRISMLPRIVAPVRVPKYKIDVNSAEYMVDE